MSRPTDGVEAAEKSAFNHVRVRRHGTYPSRGDRVRIGDIRSHERVNRPTAPVSCLTKHQLRARLRTIPWNLVHLELTRTIGAACGSTVPQRQ
jgi:hypothetical protein